MRIERTQLLVFNACDVSGGLVPMGQGAATAITPQGERTPTGLPTRNPGQRPSGSKMHKSPKQGEKIPGRKGKP